jgi:hypothetical protein
MTVFQRLITETYVTAMPAMNLYSLIPDNSSWIESKKHASMKRQPPTTPLELMKKFRMVARFGLRFLFQQANK